MPQKQALVLGGGNILGQLITRKLVVNHGYQVTCAYRVQFPLKDSILSHPQCLHNVFLCRFPPQQGPFATVESLNDANIELKQFDCIVHNTGVLFNDEYSPRGFKKMAATMLSNFKQRLLLDPALYNKLDEDLQNLAKTSFPATESPPFSQSDDIGRIPAEPSVFNSRNLQNAYEILESYVGSKEGNHHSPKTLGVSGAPACSFIYISPQHLLSPFRQPGDAMDLSTLDDGVSVLKQGRSDVASTAFNRGSKCQVSAINKVLRPITVEPGLMWYERSTRTAFIGPLGEDFVTLPPPFNTAILTSLERSTFEGFPLDQRRRTKREADLKHDLQNLLLPAPTHVDVVAEAVIRAIVDPKINGIIDTESMRKMVISKAAANPDAPQPDSKSYVVKA